jgi:hypothetical protein
MTRSTPKHRLPGDRLLALARLIFDEPALSTVVSPALADLQQEMREAGASRVKRLTARVRGYVAFSRLVLSAPFITPSSPLGSPLTSLVLGTHGGNLLLVLAVALLAAIAPVFGWFAVAVIAFGSLLAIALRLWNNRHPEARAAADPLVSLSAVTLLAALWSMFGWFVVATIAGGALMAIVLRRWNTRHPSALAPANPLASRPDAEINLSSIPVAGDIGGLLFVIGAIVTVLLGLPDIRWFVLGSVVVGCVLASSLFVWRSSHTEALGPANSILRR